MKLPHSSLSTSTCVSTMYGIEPSLDITCGAYDGHLADVSHSIEAEVDD